MKSDADTIVRDAMAAYAKETISERAIPDARDGLKPVNRLVLWQTHLSKLGASAKHMKVAKLSGLVLGFHPHGSGSVDGAIVGMSQQWKRRVPLIDIHGNNGHVDGSPPAASRYIEGRQAPAAALLLDKIDVDAVNMIDNFDATAKQPECLPARFPHALTNGASGIALGMATSIIPHNPVELLEIAKKIVLGETDYETVYHGPDFPTGGDIISGNALDDLKSSKVSVKVVARSHVEGNDTIIIDEVPYGSTVDQLIASIAKIAPRLGNVITAVNDESGTFPDVRVVITTRKMSHDDLEQTRQYIAMHACTSTASANNLMLVNGHPATLNVVEAVTHFVEFRRLTLSRIWTEERRRLAAELEIVDSEIKAIDFLDTVMQLLHESHDKTELVEGLMSRLSINERQATHIASMQVASLLRADVKRRESLDARHDSLEQSIADRDNWLGDGADTALLADIDETIGILNSHGLGDRRTGQVSVASATPHVSQVKRARKKQSLPRAIWYDEGTTVAHCSTLGTAPEGVIETMSDDVAHIIMASGKLVGRTVSDIGADERLVRSVPGLEPDDSILAIAPHSFEGGVIIVTDAGAVKHIPCSRLPVQSSKTMLRKVYSVVKDNATEHVVFARLVRADATGLLDIHTSNPRKRDITLDIADIVKRNDTCAAKGMRVVNLSKDGHEIVSVELKEN